MSELVKYSEQTFESIKHVNEYGEEYWLARELQPVLEYAQWRRFSDAIERAKLACKNSGFAVEDHFADVGKSLPMPIGCDLHGAEHGGAILAERIKKRSGFFLLRIRERNTCVVKVITLL